MSSQYPAVVGYMLINQIGGGRFSIVFCAINFLMHLIATCKLITFTHATTPAICKSTEKEVPIHSILKHPHILEFLNAIVVETKHVHLYVLGIYMLMELTGSGDLFNKIIPDMGIKDDVAHLYFNDYIHSQGMCHHDLKPLNLDELYSTELINVWGISIILYAMFAGNTLWDKPTTASPEFTYYISSSIFDKQPWSCFTIEALYISSIICGLLTIDPCNILTLADAFQHPWCIHPSQLTSQMPSVLTEQLTAPLHTNSDMVLAVPDLHMSSHKDHDANADEDREGDVNTNKDEPMPSTQLSQFTQSLMLFMCLSLYLLTPN
ncbi:Serine/threonine-protein kinase CHK1 [Termitomyces sp. J132]|nr:Serine/threonine-protein kinase CHK1 [Termitomyces sp. J132]